MAARSVLHEIDQLRSMLRPDGLAVSYGSPTSSVSYGPRLYTALSNTTEVSMPEVRAITWQETTRLDDMHKLNVYHQRLLP